MFLAPCLSSFPDRPTHGPCPYVCAWRLASIAHLAKLTAPPASCRVISRNPQAFHPGPGGPVYGQLTSHRTEPYAVVFHLLRHTASRRYLLLAMSFFLFAKYKTSLCLCVSFEGDGMYML